ncbi:hypothetical protein NY08_499 [Rhodococcus sp. B7740]|nr:hypothetical protein NY08_499 [Rhodococcus sp. B7740]
MNEQLPPQVRCRLRFYMLFIVGLVGIIVVASLAPLVGGA